MAPVIWGLDLKEMQWRKFKGSYMFNRDYHLRRSKMIVYQIAMILCVCSESVGTAALSDYVKEQNRIQSLHDRAQVHNDDFIGTASYNIFVGIYIATIFGSGFFFDLFWPERYESPSVKFAWKVCSILACVFGLADALALTVVVAMHKATITGPPGQVAVAQAVVNPPLVYRDNARAIAAVVLLWPGWVATVASTVIMFMSLIHNDEYGPKTAHLREEEKAIRNNQAPHTNGLAATTNGAADPRGAAPSPPNRQSKLGAYRSGRWRAD